MITQNVFVIIIIERSDAMKIFIGCSAKEEISSKFKEEAIKICDAIAQDNTLVFGVDSHGIMGICYHTFKKHNSKVIGITNTTYQDEFKIIPCDTSIVVDSTLERTKLIIEHSEIFLFLPGGIGTFAELFNTLEEVRTYKLNKKIIIYNQDNYYEPVLTMINQGIKEQFIKESDLNYITIINNINDLQDIIKNIKTSFVS